MPFITVFDVMVPVIVKAFPALGDVSFPLIITLLVPSPVTVAPENIIGVGISESLNEPLVKPAFKTMVMVDLMPVIFPVICPL